MDASTDSLFPAPAILWEAHFSYFFRKTTKTQESPPECCPRFRSNLKRSTCQHPEILQNPRKNALGMSERYGRRWKQGVSQRTPPFRPYLRTICKRSESHKLSDPARGVFWWRGGKSAPPVGEQKCMGEGPPEHYHLWPKVTKKAKQKH